MGKNVTGGKYAKKQKNKGAVRERAEQPDPEESQSWAMVTTLMGHCRVALLLADGEKSRGVIRGALRKRVYIRPGDIVLVTERETAEETWDVVFKYDEGYIASLKKTEPQLPFWKAAYQLHIGGAGPDDDDEDQLVNFVEVEEDPRHKQDDEEAEEVTSGSDESSGSEEDTSDLDIDAI